MSLKGSLVFKCNCGEKIEINSSDFDFDNTWTDEDRGMGDEIGFEAEVYSACPSCDKVHTIKYEFSEYPVGAINYENLIIDNDIEVVLSTLTMF